jgi:hypothetical protein
LRHRLLFLAVEIARLTVDGRLEVGPRLVRFALGLIGEAAPRERAGKAAVDLERRVVVGDGLVQIALQPPDIATAAKRRRDSRSPA